MNEFRIIQTQPLTEVLPYEVQEYRRVWYSLWPAWYSIKERAAGLGRSPLKVVPRRFQTPREANIYIAQLLVLRANQQAEQQRHLEERQLHRQHLPRIVEVLHTPMSAS